MSHLSKKDSKYEREKDESLREEKPRFGVTPLTTMPPTCQKVYIYIYNFNIFPTF